MKAHLTRILEALDDRVGAFDAMDWLVGHHRGDISAAMHELQAFRETAQRLLDGAVAFDPGPGRTGRDEPQLRTELTRQAFFELIEILESVGVPVGATGGRAVQARVCSPASSLMRSAFEVCLETVKVLVLQRRSSK